MSYKTNLTYAWLAYVSIISVTFLVDYYVRITSDDFRYSGLNELVWIAAIALAACTGGYFMIKAMKLINAKSYKTIYLLSNIILGFTFYAVLSYLYIVGFDIDSI